MEINSTLFRYDLYKFWLKKRGIGEQQEPARINQGSRCKRRFKSLHEITRNPQATFYVVLTIYVDTKKASN